MPKKGETAVLHCEKCRRKTPHICIAGQEQVGREGILVEWQCKKCGKKQVVQLA